MKALLAALLMVPLLCQAIERDANGRIHRSRAEVAKFKRLHPCPATGLPKGPCKGWTVDHISPLDCGGPDKVSNMQWQTTQDAKIKDRWERRECGK